MENICQLHIEKGFEIGYRSSLAKVTNKIELKEGTHYLFARNGRGKTTLLRTLAGSLNPIAGKYEAQGPLQYLSEDLKFDGELTVKAIFKALLPKGSLEKAKNFIESLEVDLNKTYGKLSTCNKRKVILVLAEFAKRKQKGNIVLLDEPLTGLDQHARDVIYQFWNNNSENVLRLISCHPDNDSMTCDSAITISDEEIHHHDVDTLQWGQIKKNLH